MCAVSTDICADHITRMLRDAGATGHAGLVLRSHHDARIAELEAALRDCVPFVAIVADKYKRDCGLTKLHPTHAAILDKASTLTGGGALSERLADKMHTEGGRHAHSQR